MPFRANIYGKRYGGFYSTLPLIGTSYQNQSENEFRVINTKMGIFTLLVPRIKGDNKSFST